MSKENMTQNDIDIIAAQRKGHDTGLEQGFRLGRNSARKELQELRAELERVALERDEARQLLREREGR